MQEVVQLRWILQLQLLNFLKHLTFLPNNDGVNDNFIVKSTGDIPFSIEIYDRSGIIVYKPNLTVTQLVGMEETVQE